MAKAKKVKIRELFKLSPIEVLKGLKTNLTIIWEDGIETEMTSREIIVNRFALAIH